MQLVKALVENFRSVENSEEFKIDSGMTCLVGKNESGKTTLLTALYRTSPIFDADAVFDRQKDYPRRYLADYEDRHPEGRAPVVTTWWELDDADKAAVERVLGKGSLTSSQIKYCRGYSVHHAIINFNTEAIVSGLVEGGDLHEEERTGLRGTKDIKQLRTKAEALSESPRRTALLERIDAAAPEGSLYKGFWKAVQLPKFMLFSHYQRMQGQVSLEQVQKRVADQTLSNDDQVFLALCEMAGTTVEKVAAIKQFEELVSRFEGASNKISGEIFRYWTQNTSLKVPA